MLTDAAKNIYKGAEKYNKKEKLPPTQTELGNMLGMSRSNVHLYLKEQLIPQGYAEVEEFKEKYVIKKEIVKVRTKKRIILKKPLED